MTIEVVLPAPRSKDIAPPTATRPHAWKKLPAKPVLGLIDNSKGRAAELLDAIGRNLVRREIVDSYFMIRKPSAGMTITEKDRADLLARAHIIVSGLGD